MKEIEVALTNEQIIESGYALGGIVQDGIMVQNGLADMMIPDIKVGFAIGQNFVAIQGALKAYGDFKTKILKQYSKLDEDGELVPDAKGKLEFTTPEDEEKAQADINALLQVEQTVLITSFSIQELIDAGVKNIMPKILSALSWMIKKQADPEEKPVKSPLAGHRRAARHR